MKQMRDKILKYIKKLPETDHELSNQLQIEGWTKIKEPKNLLFAMLLSFPFAIFLGGIVILIGYFLKPELFSFITPDSLSITIKFDLKTLLYIITLFVYMFIHEMLHAVFIPNFAKSDKTFWGLNGIFGFVFTTEPITKERFLFISFMPFVLLSIGAIFIFYICGVLTTFTFLLCIINAAGSCVDFLNMTLIGFQVKRYRTIISNGFETFYSPA